MNKNPYKDIIHTLPEIVFELDSMGHFTYLNESIKKLYYTPEDLMGKHFSIFIHPDDYQLCSREKVLPGLQGVSTGNEGAPKLFDERRSGNRLTKDLKLRIRDGKNNENFIFCTIVSLGISPEENKESNTAYGSVGYILVEHEEKRSEDLVLLAEKHYRLLIENLTEVITIIFPDGTILFKSDSIKEILGYDPFNLIGENELEYIHPDDREILLSYINPKKTDENRAVIEFRYKDAPGNWKFLKTNIKKVLDPLGMTMCFILNSHDISKLKESEEELKAARDLAEASNEIKNNMISILSHDLKSPLSAIHEFLKNLDENLDFLDRESLKMMISMGTVSSGTLIKLVDNLINWGRNLLNKKELLLESLEIGPLITDLFLIFDDSILKKNISLENNLPADVTIYSNRGILSSVLRNILSNAVKFSHHNGKIFLDYNKTDFFHVITVRDTGVGFNKTTSNELFSLKTKYYKDGTDGEKGSGLGLFLCNDLINRIGGKITFSSKKDHGASFNIHIPLQ